MVSILSKKDSLSYSCAEEAAKPRVLLKGVLWCNPCHVFFLYYLQSFITTSALNGWTIPMCESARASPVCERIPLQSCVCACVCACMTCHRKTDWMNISQWRLAHTLLWQQKLAFSSSHACACMCERERKRNPSRSTVALHACLPTLLNHAVGMEMEQSEEKKQKEEIAFLVKREEEIVCEWTEGEEREWQYIKLIKTWSSLCHVKSYYNLPSKLH